MAPSAALRLAALAVFVEEDVARLADRLRLSNAEQAVLALGALGVDAALPGEEAAKALLYRIGPDAYRSRLLLAWADTDAVPRMKRGATRLRFPNDGKRRYFRSAAMMSWRLASSRARHRRPAEAARAGLDRFGLCARSRPASRQGKSAHRRAAKKKTKNRVTTTRSQSTSAPPAKLTQVTAMNQSAAISAMPMMAVWTPVSGFLVGRPPLHR